MDCIIWCLIANNMGFVYHTSNKVKMKILSKYKDYYDYLKGIYGEDEKIILDRRMSNKPLIMNEEIVSLYICDMIINGFCHNNVVYFGDELDNILDKVDNDNVLRYKKYRYYYSSNLKITHTIDTKKFKNIKRHYYLNNQLIEAETKFNSLLNCPILLSSTFGELEYNRNKFIAYPKLEDLNVQKAIPAEKIWQLLSDWISRKITENEAKVPIGDDKLRIQTHGFDLKSSFRPKMK
jgi:hypothetical protein